MDALFARRKIEASTYFENLMTKLEELETVFQQKINDEKNVNSDLYFRDGVRRIDYVFVYKRSNRPGVKKLVNQYIANLENEGVEFEVGESTLHPELLFINVHVCRVRLLMCSVLLNYEAEFMRAPEAPISATRIINLPFMYSELTRRELLSEVVQRASESSLGGRPKDLTSAERIMITGEILKNVNFGTEHFETGLRYLLDNKYLVAAFPLHEQPSAWTSVGTLNDRQLLLKYWARYSNVFKYQPVDLIHKYYGAEVAFYFAFLGFYNRMLIPVAILGALAFAYGSITSDSEKNLYSRIICTSKAYFCPACQDNQFCSFREVAQDCDSSKIHYAMDNVCTIFYAIIMCFWATIVSELWKREENILKYKWNLLTVENDTRPRPEYTKYATHKRVNKYSGEFEFYIPQKIHTLKLIISWICCGFLALIVVVMVIGTIFIRLTIIYAFNLNFKILTMGIDNISHLLSTAALFVCMKIFDNIYKYVAKKLTDFECPRTQAQYDKSFIFKLHVLSILNAYAYLYYTAFFKGSFRTYPGDEEQYKSIGILNNDVDAVLGNMLPLNLQLLIILTAKTVFRIFYEFMGPLFVMKYRKWKVRKGTKDKDYAYRSWEKDYHRRQVDYYDIAVNEFKTIITQYGYLILFPAAFTLGPLLAFVANMIELRIDAYKLSKWSRRPVPMRVPGIGAWNSILNTLSYIGIITNCFYIAFTTNFIYFLRVYFNDERDLNILDMTCSEFNVKDYKKSSDFYGVSVVDKCLYLGIRFPPEHPRKYEHNKAYWQTRCSQLISVIVLEGLVLGFNKLLSFAIPDMPAHIKERVRLRRHKENVAREKRLNEKYKTEDHTRTSLTREQIATRLKQMQPNM